jgi:hypothetical protein
VGKIFYPRDFSKLVSSNTTRTQERQVVVVPHQVFPLRWGCTDQYLYTMQYFVLVCNCSLIRFCSQPIQATTVIIRTICFLALMITYSCCYPNSHITKFENFTISGRVKRYIATPYRIHI